MSRQRRFGPTSTIRSSPYDVASSPVQKESLRKRPFDGPANFSPLKRPKRPRTAGDAPLAGTVEIRRRSPRKHRGSVADPLTTSKDAALALDGTRALAERASTYTGIETVGETDDAHLFTSGSAETSQPTRKRGMPKSLPKAALQDLPDSPGIKHGKGRGRTYQNKLAATTTDPSSSNGEARLARVPSQPQSGRLRTKSRTAKTVLEKSTSTIPFSGGSGLTGKLPKPSRVERMEKPNLPRPSEIYPREEHNDAQRQVKSKTDGQGRLAASNERQSASNSIAEKASSKTQQAVSTPLERQGEESVREADRDNMHRFFGQGHVLQGIFDNLKEVGVSYRNGERICSNIEQDDEDVAALVILCDQAHKDLKKMEEDTQDSVEKPHCPTQFSTIRARIDMLCGKDPENLPHLQDQHKVAEMYFHLVPCLVRLLKQLVESYERMDLQQANHFRTVTNSHLRVVLSLVKMILDLGLGLDQYARPRSSLAVVKPVNNMILAPLKKVNEALQRRLERYTAAQENAVLLATQREQEEQRAHDEQQEETRRVEIGKLRRKWKCLHAERRAVEPGIISASRLKHLRLSGPQSEVDQNGEQFERLELFTPRIGPLPAVITRASQVPWTSTEIEALCEGLQTYHGELVFERIFRALCGRGRVLNKYNVIEIVTKAAELKEGWLQDGMEDEWVISIPSWTKPHCLSGKENEVG